MNLFWITLIVILFSNFRIEYNFQSLPNIKSNFKDQALKDLINIIEKNKGKRVYISIYTLGKEEMLICLAEYFKTLVIYHPNCV